jgi:hypothetical protein
MTIFQTHIHHLSYLLKNVNATQKIIDKSTPKNMKFQLSRCLFLKACFKAYLLQQGELLSHLELQNTPEDMHKHSFVKHFFKQLHFLNPWPPVRDRILTTSQTLTSSLPISSIDINFSLHSVHCFLV